MQTARHPTKKKMRSHRKRRAVVVTRRCFNRKLASLGTNPPTTSIVVQLAATQNGWKFARPERFRRNAFVTLALCLHGGSAPHIPSPRVVTTPVHRRTGVSHLKGAAAPYSAMSSTFGAILFASCTHASAIAAKRSRTFGSADCSARSNHSAAPLVFLALRQMRPRAGGGATNPHSGLRSIKLTVMPELRF